MSRNIAVHHGRRQYPGQLHCTRLHFCFHGGRYARELRQLRQQAGPGGTEGTAWDLAWAWVFLDSDEARWISGAVLPVDAGLFTFTPLAMLRRRQDEA